MPNVTVSPLIALESKTTSSLAPTEPTATAQNDAPDCGVAVSSADVLAGKAAPVPAHKEAYAAQLIEDQCRTLSRSIFFRGPTDTHVLGFTSAVAGEGRTFLATACATLLARDTQSPVVLLECDWEHPSYQALFDLPARRGLAEWLRGEADITDIRYQVQPHLTVIPSGDGAHESLHLIRRLRNPGTWEQLLSHDALVIMDLPPILSCAYGRLAAELPDAVIMVVRAGATQGSQVAQACGELTAVDVRGILLNQVRSHVPGWLRSIL